MASRAASRAVCRRGDRRAGPVGDGKELSWQRVGRLSSSVTVGNGPKRPVCSVRMSPLHPAAAKETFVRKGTLKVLGSCLAEFLSSPGASHGNRSRGPVSFELEREAEHTRADLADTVDKLHNRVSPQAIKEEVKAYAREASYDLIHNLERRARQTVAVTAGLAYPVWRLLINASTRPQTARRPAGYQ
jgi:Protein of unknown function (DUF3618)